MLLTATPVINYLNDLAFLVNIVKKSDALPTYRSLFNNIYYDEENFIIRNEDILKTKLNNCISYFKDEGSNDYPIHSTKIIEIEMNKDQLEQYVYYVKKIIYDGLSTHNYSDLLNINFDKLHNKKKNFFLNATRQLSNCGKETFSPKIRAIYDKIIECNEYPVIIYSNFLKNGIYLLAKLLEENDISYKAITGSTHNDKISLIVDRYNNRQFKVLLISSAGSESLDLKNTRQIHIMEPHWSIKSSIS